jgi:hypothetical protein
MLKGGNKLAMLPSPILSLKNTYLATIFDDFTKTSPHFLKISRQAFQSVYPHLKVTIKTDDVLFNVVSLFSFMKSSLSSTYRATSVLLNDKARFVRWRRHCFRTTSDPRNYCTQKSLTGSIGFVTPMEVRFSMRGQFPSMAHGIPSVQIIR